jgi:hypothetical protein
MKGMVMAQRILIAACLVMVVACCSMVGVVWSQSTRSAAQAAEANRRLAEALGQSQATNQEMLRQLHVIAKASQSPKSTDWIPVKVRLTLDKPGGPPAVGYSVALGRGSDSYETTGAIYRHSDATGLADFGVVQPGDWGFRIRTDRWQATGSFNVIPDTPVIQSIICPKDPPDPSRVRIRIDWPARLAGKDLRATALFQEDGVSYQPPLRWQTTHRMEILCGPNGEACLPDDFVQLEVRGLGWEQVNGFSEADHMAKGLIHARMNCGDAIDEKSPLAVGAGRYSLKRLMLFRPVDIKKPVEGREFQLLTLMNREDEQVAVVNRVFDSPGYVPVSYVYVKGVRIRPSPLASYDHFEARPGETAEWTIAPPEEMIKEVEKRLKSDASTEKAG